MKKVVNSLELKWKTTEGIEHRGSSSIHEYYNDKGKLIRSDIFDRKLGDSKEVYEYDDEGRLIWEDRGYLQRSHSFQKDEDGNIIEHISIQIGDSHWLETSVTSKDGHIIYEDSRSVDSPDDESGSLESGRELSYDDKGMLVHEVGCRLVDGKLVDYETEYTYRKEGLTEITEAVETMSDGTVDKLVTSLVKGEKDRIIEKRVENNGVLKCVTTYTYFPGNDNHWVQHVETFERFIVEGEEYVGTIITTDVVVGEY